MPRREAILIDVGAQGTGLSLIRHDALVATCWWAQGGAFFTDSLAQAFRCSPEEAEALKRAYTDHALSTEDEDLVARSLTKPVAAWSETLVARLNHMAKVDMTHQPAPANHYAGSLMVTEEGEPLPGRIYLTGGGSLLPDLPQSLLSLESTTSLSFRRSLEVESLGRWLGVRGPGLPTLFDVPPHPISDLLTPALSLATCLE